MVKTRKVIVVDTAWPKLWDFQFIDDDIHQNDKSPVYWIVNPPTVINQ